MTYLDLQLFDLKQWVALRVKVEVEVGHLQPGQLMRMQVLSDEGNDQALFYAPSLPSIYLRVGLSHHRHHDGPGRSMLFGSVD